MNITMPAAPELTPEVTLTLPEIKKLSETKAVLVARCKATESLFESWDDYGKYIIFRNGAPDEYIGDEEELFDLDDTPIYDIYAAVI